MLVAKCILLDLHTSIFLTTLHKCIFLFLHWVYFPYIWLFLCLFKSFKVMHSCLFYILELFSLNHKSNQYYLSLLLFLFKSQSVCRSLFILYSVPLVHYFMGFFWTGLNRLVSNDADVFLSFGTFWCEDGLLLFYSSLFYLRCPIEFSSTKVHFLNIYI